MLSREKSLMLSIKLMNLDGSLRNLWGLMVVVCGKTFREMERYKSGIEYVIG